MSENVYSRMVADGFLAWVVEPDYVGLNATGPLCRVGEYYNAMYDWNIEYRSYLSFDTTAFESISDWQCWLYIDEIVGSVPPGGFYIVGLGGWGNFIGAELDEYDWGCAPANATFGFTPITTTGWMQNSWRNLANINPGGYSDHECYGNWAYQDGQSRYVVVRTTEYSAPALTYSPYLVVTGVLKDRKTYDTVRLSPRVSRVRPVRQPRRIVV